jgi:carbohydrate-selective porin OprB
LTLKDRDGNLRGNVRIRGYYDTSQVWDYATRAIANITLAPLETNAVGLANNAAAIASIQPNYVRGRSGAYVQMDHTIGSGSGAGQAGTALFAAFEYSDPQTSLVNTMLDIGVVRHGTFRERNADTIAAGFATDNYHVRLQRLEATLQTEGYAVPSTVQDQAVELNYGLQATPWFTLRPGLQYVINPGGIKSNPGAGVLNPARNALVLAVGGNFTL